VFPREDPSGSTIVAPSRPAVIYSTRATYTRVVTVAPRVVQKAKVAAIRQQKVIAGADAIALVTNDKSGFGLQRPYIPWNAYATNLETNPAAAAVVSTTSASFVSLITCANEPQHPRIRVRVRVVTGAGTSGEVRLRDRLTGQVLVGSGVLVVGVASTVEANIDGTLVAPILTGVGAAMKVDVEARTTAGANTIAVLIVYSIGIGT